MKKFLLVVGARPNFMKVAPLYRALIARGAEVTLVHTGQHFLPGMSDVFFTELGIPEPHVHLGIGQGDRITSTRKIISALTEYLKQNPHDRVVVFGDVTSAAAATIAAVQVGIPVAHVEAGLRSFHWPMPEELNRMIADHHSDMLFVTEPSGIENLRNEAIADERMHLVGNIMIDTLRRAEPHAERSEILSKLGLAPQSYGALTLHRPENVDRLEAFEPLWDAVSKASERMPLVLPLHPRTQTKLEYYGLAIPPGVRIIEPLGYLDMLALTKNAKFVMTDSGGLQEESYVLGVPCLTLRGQTERPITVEMGTSEIVGRDRAKILDAIDRILADNWKKGTIHDLWDGKASERIADILMK